ncbi:putative 4-coumarate--CoA ligase 1 [Convolutriloba macropyga]|uniref:putative 4-coumarate--CoA ligase 1 n=1 Tax=Convolutriloba macropyga TaxID=536237 RepID=UPI003F51D7EC
MASYFKFEDLKSIVPIPEPGNRSFADFFLEKVERYPRSWFVDASKDEKMYFSELVSRIRHCSSNLIKHGYKKGDTVCLMSKNCLNFTVALVASSLAHIQLSPANPVFTGQELLYQLEVSGSRSLIIANNLLSTLEEAVKVAKQKKSLILDEIFVLDLNSDTPTTIAGVTLQPFENLLQSVDDQFLQPESTLDPKNDIWLLPFSSGTTGLPKGVALTHYNLLANVWQFSQYDNFFKVGPDSTIVGVLPMYHMYGLFIYGLCFPVRGGNVVLLPEFQPVNFLMSIQKYKATHVYIVPPLALFLSKDPRVKDYDLMHVQDVVSAAAPLALESAEELADVLAEKGSKDVVIRQAWGMTELSPLATLGALNETDRSKLFGSIGDPLPMTEIKIVDLESNETVQLGDEGEICVRGPQVMQGYYKNEEATRNTIDEEGWLHSGDIGRHVNSQFLITDRLKELIKTKGHQVAPAELEGILLTHPSVQDCCVFGLPHSSLGEAPSAAVVLRPGTPHATVTDTQLSSFVASRVAPYKQLAGGIRFIDLIPKTASGKILRRVLRARYL